MNIDFDSLKFLASKSIGYAIVIFSAILKVPQIINMNKKRSAEGLSEISCMADVLACLFLVVYAFHVNSPFSTYGENLFILIQNFLILLLVYNFTNWKVFSLNFVQRMVFIPILLIFSYISVFMNIISENQWSYIASSPIVLVIISRIAQIINSFKEKSTGALTAFSFILSVLGCAARLFTLIVDNPDIFLLLNSAVAMILNAIILLQIFIYRKSEEEVKKESGLKKD